MTTQRTPTNADVFLDWLNFQKNERLPKLKSANGTSSTIIANVIKGWEKEYTWLSYDDENNAMFWQNIALFSFGSSCRGRGQDTSTIEIRGKNVFRDRKAGLVKSLAD